MKKNLLLILVVILMLCGCTSNNKIAMETSDSITPTIYLDGIEEYDVIEAEYKKGVCLIKYPQVRGMADQSLQNRINDLLKEEVLYNVKELVLDEKLSSYELTYSIRLQSQRVLSIQYYLYSTYENEAHPNNQSFSTNVDLVNAKRLSLQDLIRNNDKLIDLLKSGTFHISEQSPVFLEEMVMSIIDKYEKNDFVSKFKNSDVISNGVQSEVYSYLSDSYLGLIVEVLSSEGGYLSVEFKYSDIKELFNSEWNQSVITKSDTLNNKNSDNSKGDYKRLYDSRENYKIYEVSKDGSIEYLYEIYSDDGNLVKSERDGYEPTITYLNDSILEICTGLGTGFWSAQYYNINENLFSEAFVCPAAENNGKIAYMIHLENDLGLIVQDIFDKNKYYKEFSLDFSTLANPDDALTRAGFINDKELKVFYLSGDDYKEKTKVLQLD